VTADRPVPLQVDGDHVGEATTVEVRHHRSALDVVVPLGSPALA
ncbi:MAG: sphingosine kinase, partial [Acidimicrobiaceae bacterium]|nr:sphingosine kinase [Acidimicrobiaceae bacterium]